MKNLFNTYRPDFWYGKGRTKSAIVLLVMLFALILQVPARQQLIPLFVEDDEINYNWYIDTEEPIDLADEHFFENSAKILFRINRYGLPKNDKTLKELKDVVLPRINQDSLELIAIVIRGGASPEGPYNNNLPERLDQRE